MKLVSYFENDSEHLGIFHDGKIFNLHANARTLAHIPLPHEMLSFLRLGKIGMDAALALDEKIKSNAPGLIVSTVGENHLLAPVPHPTSCRDGYAFRQHVETARRNRKLAMIPEFDQFPIFYFTNHNSIVGPGEVQCMPDHFLKLDFELEVAIVIGKQGKNIRAEEADSYIAGYLIMNDLSARTLQMEEMVLNLGPAKGKDFATAIGPWLVTPDELESKKVNAPSGHFGNCYELGMICKVNGVTVSEGNLSDMNWTFAEIIERASYGVDLYPGDVIGSGTVGTGCFLELNGTGKLNNPDYKEQWLQPGDVVEMEVEGLGRLTNKVVKVNDDYSLIERKKLWATKV